MTVLVPNRPLSHELVQYRNINTSPLRCGPGCLLLALLHMLHDATLTRITQLCDQPIPRTPTSPCTHSQHEVRSLEKREAGRGTHRRFLLLSHVERRKRAPMPPRQVTFLFHGESSPTYRRRPPSPQRFPRRPQHALAFFLEGKKHLRLTARALSLVGMECKMIKRKVFFFGELRQ